MSGIALTSKTSDVATFFAAAAVAAASFWDFRLFDLRLFDCLALGCLGVYFILAPEARAGFMLRRRNFWLLFVVTIFYAALGYILHSHRSSLAIAALAVVGFVLIGRRDWLGAIRPLLWPLVSIHMLFFLIQFGAFYGFHYVIDYQTVTGSAARIMIEQDHMRAAGVFQEPNSYCLNLLVLVSIAIINHPSRPLTMAAALTVLLSESFWGIGASIVLLLLNEMRLQQSPRRFAIALSISIVAISIAFNVYLWLGKNRGYATPYTYGRIVGILNDPSLRERYIQNTCSEQAAIEDRPARKVAKWTFGEGLTTQLFKECLPANGIAFLLKSFGAVGIILILSSFVLATRGLSVGAKLYTALALAFSLTSYPLITYVLFWLWLPAMMGFLRLKNAGLDSEIRY